MKYNISVYIFNWKKVSENSLKLYENIKKFINHVTIINCDENFKLDDSIKHIQLDDSHYYGSQYEHAIKDVPEGSIFCIIVGDNIANNNFEKIFDEAIKKFNTYNIGVYAPNDKRSPHINRKEEIESNIYNVDNTDCGFWFISPKIVSKLRNINYANLSHFGWGIDFITIEEARHQGLLVLRDYNIETDQLDRSTNYDFHKASLGQNKIINEYKRIKNLEH